MANLTGVECHDLWMCFIIASYLTSIQARGSLNCPDCNSNRECNNYYCLACKEGGLCPMKFKANRPHDHHPWLQVRRVSNEHVVIAPEVETFLGENANRIQKFIGNKQNIFKLKTPPRTMGKRAKGFEDPLQLICKGCNFPISKTSNSKDGVEVCSIECLITYAKQMQQLECLRLKAGIDLQNHAFECPLIMEEKIQLQLQKRQNASALGSMPMSSAHAEGTTLVKDEEVKEAQEASASCVAHMVDRNEIQVRVYDYSAFPLGYECRDLDELCDIFNVITE